MTLPDGTWMVAGEHDILRASGIPQLSFPTTQEGRIDLWLSGYVAYDLEHGIRLDASRGRRKAGRKTRYMLYYGPDNGEQDKGFCRFTAGDDVEAVEKANAILAKKYAESKS